MTQLHFVFLPKLIVMKFDVGEEVVFLYERGGGIIREIDAMNRAIIEDETGFERPFLFNEIGKKHSDNYDLNDNFEYKVESDSITSNTMIRSEILQGRKKASEVWEIDLHIENLLESHRGMSNAEILHRQMTDFRAFFKRAQTKMIPKIVVIHGVGEGVLKNEIRMFLAKKDNLEFYDASYMDYGKGATEIRLYNSAH